MKSGTKKDTAMTKKAKAAGPKGKAGDAPAKRTAPKKAAVSASKTKKVVEDGFDEDIEEIKPKKKAPAAKAAPVKKVESDDEDDLEETEDVDLDDDGFEREDDDVIDKEFEEFEIPKSKSAKAPAKKKPSKDDDFEEFKDLGIFHSSSGFDEEDDDF